MRGLLHAFKAEFPNKLQFSNEDQGCHRISKTRDCINVPVSHCPEIWNRDRINEQNATSVQEGCRQHVSHNAYLYVGHVSKLLGRNVLYFHSRKRSHKIAAGGWHVDIVLILGGKLFAYKWNRHVVQLKLSINASYCLQLSLECLFCKVIIAISGSSVQWSSFRP